MKNDYLKLFVLAIALTAAAQSVHRAYAQYSTSAAHEGEAADVRVLELLAKKALLESQGRQLNIEEKRVLFDSLQESLHKLKKNFPQIVDKPDSPAV